jgi:hypothetical protein
LDRFAGSPQKHLLPDITSVGCEIEKPLVGNQRFQLQEEKGRICFDRNGCIAILTLHTSSSNFNSMVNLFGIPGRSGKISNCIGLDRKKTYYIFTKFQ